MVIYTHVHLVSSTPTTTHYIVSLPKYSPCNTHVFFFLIKILNLHIRRFQLWNATEWIQTIFKSDSTVRVTVCLCEWGWGGKVVRVEIILHSLCLLKKKHLTTTAISTKQLNILIKFLTWNSTLATCLNFPLDQF